MASPPRRRASPPYLPDELVEEILLRLPPDDPACILRASLVCKAWSSAISLPGFRRRFHEHHRTPPVLGFLHDHITNFISTTATSFSLAAPDWRSWRAIDCRHGRALFLSKGEGAWELLLWEPITGVQRRVPVPSAASESEYPTAAVLCAADGCDHRDCLGGPFRVVLVFYIATYSDEGEKLVISACVYSSETGAWSEPTLLHNQVANFTEYSSVLVGNSLLYFMTDGERILEYDLAGHKLTELLTPDDSVEQKYRLMLAGNGELLVSESSDNRCLTSWSKKLSGWDVSREIYYGNFLPSAALEDWVCVLGFAEGANAIFVSTRAGLYMIDLHSEQARKVWDDVRGCGNLIPVVGFYTPHHHLLPPTKEEALKFAHELFDKGCKAMQEGNFTTASDCFGRALKIRVLHYGKFAPQCASTFYRYGRALLCKVQAATNPLGSVPKSALNEESVKITATARKDALNSSASLSNVDHVSPSHRRDSEEGKMNSKEQEDVKMTCNEADSDLHLAWNMLDIARVIVAKSPEKTMVEVNIFSALADVCMKREDTGTAIGYYLEALPILEHLVKPDHIMVVLLNFRICLAFELASKVEDAIPYCAKAISVCQSLKQNLKNDEEALLAEFTQEDKISFFTGMLARFQKKLEELKQAISKPSSGIDKITKRVVSRTCHEQNVSNTVATSASLDSQVAGSNNDAHLQTMSTAAETGSIGSSVSIGMKRANDELISAEPSPKRLAADGKRDSSGW